MKLSTLTAAGLTILCFGAYAENTTPTAAPVSDKPASVATSDNKAVASLTDSSTATTSTATVSAPVVVSTPATTSANTEVSTSSDTSTQLLATNTDKISYAIGVDIGRNFRSQGLSINSHAIAKGIDDGLSGGKTLMTAKEMEGTLVSFQKDLISKRQAQFTQMSTQNKQTGDSFLATNKAKPGVVTLPDGLQYKIIKEGVGTSPAAQDVVTVNYTGTFTDGKIFDSSYQRGKPVSFPVSEVIPGWTEALKMMKPGAVWEIFVPPSLGYGERGAGPIGPNQTLIFKIELIGVNSPTAKK